MAALTAASWTLVITHKTRGNRCKVVEGTLALAGTDTYPDEGIPLPVKEKFGFLRDVRNIVFFGLDAQETNYVEEYDKTNHKLLLYEEEAVAAGGPLLECDTAEVPGPRTWNFRAEGW